MSKLTIIQFHDNVLEEILANRRIIFSKASPRERKAFDSLMSKGLWNIDSMKKEYKLIIKRSSSLRKAERNLISKICSEALAKTTVNIQSPKILAV